MKGRARYRKKPIQKDSRKEGEKKIKEKREKGRERLA